MKHRFDRMTAIVLSCLAIAVVIGLLILLFVTTRPDKTTTIVLPDPEQTAAQPPAAVPPVTDGFLTVNTDNVLQIVAELSRPASYHQICTVTVMNEDAPHTGKVEMWVDHQLLHAVITDPFAVKHLLTDHQQAYIWYEGDETPLQVTLTEDMSADDLMGLPTYETLLAVDPQTITDAGYLLTENTDTHCIFVSAAAGEETACRYWIDLSTGLLLTSDVVENSRQIYMTRQDSFELLARNDETFAAAFTLPDGSSPFTDQAQEQQP